MDKLAGSKISYTFWAMNLVVNTSLPRIVNRLKVAALPEVKPVILTVPLEVLYTFIRAPTRVVSVLKTPLEVRK